MNGVHGEERVSPPTTRYYRLSNSCVYIEAFSACSAFVLSFPYLPCCFSLLAAFCLLLETTPNVPKIQRRGPAEKAHERASLCNASLVLFSRSPLLRATLLRFQRSALGRSVHRSRVRTCVLRPRFPSNDCDLASSSWRSASGRAFCTKER